MPQLDNIQFRRGTAANWASVNPVLGSGEPGYETDTGLTKIGDGTTAWNSLKYENSSINGVSVSTVSPENRDTFRFDETQDKFVYTHTNEYNAQQDGFYITKDNDDVERKFWKDDFSVDSSSQYTGDVASFTWDTANSRLEIANVGQRTLAVNNCQSLAPTKISFVISVPSETDGQNGVYFTTNGVQYICQFSTSDRRLYLYQGVTSLRYTPQFPEGWDASIPVIGVITLNPSSIVMDAYVEGVKYSTTYGATTTGASDLGIFTYNPTSTCYFHDLTVSPSISYADEFSTDTTERYQAVTGTVAYDDANKRMNVTTAEGANGKASGRLKSYKFCEGSQIYDVLLPTGADGDFICMVTHATDPAMTNGIGVGLQSDGAGNWNLVTLSGTTVTVGASSGLTDGKTARIEIEKDITGAYWYYIYDAAGAKPTAATGKLFTSLTEGYTGWYANGAGATTQTYAIENISIRAESIVGRTNVEVTEPFWFRDEFGEDSRGRYVTPETNVYYDGENNEYYTFGRYGIYIIDHPTFIGETIVTIQTRNTGVSTDCLPCVVFGEPKKIYVASSANNFIYGNPTLCVRFSPSNVQVLQNGKVVPGATSDAIKYQSGETQTFVVTYNGSNQITVSDGTNSITFTDDAFAVRTVFSAFIGTYSGGWDNGVNNRFKLIEISGTRVYQKPIHRGAMLETYHDGTEEVVGTTFIDDCQWDRSEEYTIQNGTATYDAANDYYTIAVTSGYYGVQEPNGVRVTEGIVSVEINREDLIFGGLLVSWDGTLTLNDSSNKIPNNGLVVYITTTGFVANLYINGAVTTSSGAISSSGWRKLQVNIIGTTANIYVNGVLLKTITNEIISAYDHVGIIGYKAAAGDATKWRNLQIIAASPDATNGIAACIPPIGGGARYDTVEEVYYEIPANSVKQGEYRLCYAGKTTNADADAVEGYFENVTDSIAITEDSSTTLTTDLTTDNASFKKSIVLDNDDRGDTIKCSVRRTSEGTNNQAVSYIEYLALAPVMEVE